MKKIIVSLFLVAAILLSMTGCSSDQKALVGQWEADIDCTDALEAEIQSSLEEEMIPYFNLSSFSMRMRLTFREDGTYSMDVDESSMQETAKIFRKDLIATMEAYMKDVAEENGIAWEDFLSMVGGSMEELMQEILPDSDMDDMVREVLETTSKSGKYKAQNGKLYMTDSASTDISDNMYDEYVLKGDTLTLVTSTENMEEFEAALYPMVFHRV